MLHAFSVCTLHACKFLIVSLFIITVTVYVRYITMSMFVDAENQPDSKAY
jgi:hypothetical protein